MYAYSILNFKIYPPFFFLIFVQDEESEAPLKLLRTSINKNPSS